jgi:hypothetical protein
VAKGRDDRNSAGQRESRVKARCFWSHMQKKVSGQSEILSALSRITPVEFVTK